MELEDIPAVMDVERQSFSTPWPGNAYRRELKENRLARYVVARASGLFVPAGQQTRDEPDTHPPDHGGWRRLLDRLISPRNVEDAARPASEVASRRVAGYAGLWLMVDESHITSIAVAPAYRGLGLGELLLLALVDISREIGAQYLTLEVRVSNDVAQNLYRKYTFKQTGVRRRYYSDNNEDAAIMWSDPLESPAFQKLVEEHRQALMDRLRSPGMRLELRSRGVQA